MPLKQLVNGKRITILYKEFDTARNALARLALQIDKVELSGEQRLSSRIRVLQGQIAMLRKEVKRLTKSD
jgi:hypothetical protein